jgi:hypothetical protein
VRKIAFGGLLLAGVAAAYVWMSPVPSVRITAWLFGSAAALSIGGGVIGRLVPGRRLKPRDHILEWRLKVLDSPVGRVLQKIATIGLDRRAALPAGVHRATEIAIGMAADQIFDSLPKDTRKALKELPALVRRLEAEAGGTRAHVDELQAMIADVAATGRSTADHDHLKEELVAKREAASQRLAVAVAALENIRLDLLRLKAGVGTVDQLTADLNAARDLQKEIELRVIANQEVEAALERKSLVP